MSDVLFDGKGYDKELIINVLNDRERLVKIGLDDIDYDNLSQANCRLLIICADLLGNINYIVNTIRREQNKNLTNNQ